MNSSAPIERRLLAFLQDVVAKEKPDLIVCSERKATAIMRAVIQEIPEPKFAWDWKNVLSSAVMDAFDWSSFKGRRILLFEELVHHGIGLKGKKDDLLKLVPSGVTIRTAGFAVWHRCEYLPDYCFYRSVDSPNYSALRDEIITVLQHHGSLLLDTEHVDLSLRINCSVRELYEELARACDAGNALEFLSASQRLNLTLLEPDILYPQRLQSLLPSGSITQSVVRKCRIIGTAHGRYSITPIFYPNVRFIIEDEWLSALPGFVKKERVQHARPKELFYIVGLLASIELLRSVVSALTDLMKAGKVILETPEDNFRHLSAMFPSVDIDALQRYVRDVVAESRRERAQRSAGAVSVQPAMQDDIINMSYLVIQTLREQLDEDPPSEGVPVGRSWQQIAMIAKADARVHANQEKTWSIVPDRLIDGGLLVTNVESINTPNSERWVIRTFSPDSETVADRLRRHASVKGSRWLPRI